MASVQPNASVVATGLGIRYIGSDPMFAYGYSGHVGIDTTEESLLEFTSQSGFIVAKIQFNYAVYSTADYAFLVKLNGSTIQSYAVTASGNYTESDVPLHVIIPPNTFVQCRAQRLDGSGDVNQVVTLTGRVYGAEE